LASCVGVAVAWAVIAVVAGVVVVSGLGLIARLVFSGLVVVCT
jgi:hypothetical protein